jgi:hypothetical protein
MTDRSNAQLESALKLGREYLAKKRAVANPTKVEYSVTPETVVRYRIDKYAKTKQTDGLGASCSFGSVATFDDAEMAAHVCELLNREAREKGISLVGSAA